MPDLPYFIPILFTVAVLLTLMFLYLAFRRSGTLLILLCVWIALQSCIGMTGFYSETAGFPPRFVLLVFPALITILLLLTLRKGRDFIDRSDAALLTLMHCVRIPVELVLYELFLSGCIPGLMTFSGRNFDILAGISAPLVWYFGMRKKKMGKVPLLVWNFLCLGLLLNIVINAILSAPFSFQQFAFDQPNIAVLHFPYVLLPGFIVPAVLLAHLVCIRRLFLMTHHHDPADMIQSVDIH